jgi:predicted dienelactone hydrolase
MRYGSASLCAFFLACGGSPVADAGLDASGSDTPSLDAPLDAGPVIGERYGAPGPHPVGNARAVMADRTGARSLPVELWYPAVEAARDVAEAGQPLAAFEAGGPNEARMEELVEGAPPSCVRATVRSALGAPALDAPALLPVVVFSHCHACTRFDVAEVSERLASHGIVVAAPDHVGNTVWDEPPAMVGTEFLAVRVSDVASVLDRLLDPGASELPEDLRGRLDPARAAVMGHSFGAATTGPLVVADDRFVAALAIAAPAFVLGAVDPADVTIPYLFLLAEEDGSIGAGGNNLLRRDFMSLDTPAWLVEVPGAGHWSFSDIAGLGGTFTAGCAALDGRFPYPDNVAMRELAADVAAGFFAAELLGDPEGEAFLGTGLAGRAAVTRRN